MGALNEINLIVKTAGSSNAGSVVDKLKGLLRKGDDTGSRVSFYTDRKTGEPYITPKVARRNIYRDNFKKILESRYSQDAADRLADEDYEHALRERYSKLKNIFSMPRFRKDENYSVAPTSAVIPSGNGAYSYGSVNKRIPIRVKDWKENSPLGAVGYLGARNVSGMSHLDLYLKDHTGKYVGQHEQSHVVDPPAYVTPLVKFIAPDSNKRFKGLRYARTPAEMMVAVINEKARMRANGIGREDVGQTWIDEIEDAINGGWKPGPVPKGKKNAGRDWDLNVDSLKNIFYETYMKAHGKDATELDKRNYRLLVDELKSAFIQARNSSGRKPENALNGISNRTWMA